MPRLLCFGLGYTARALGRLVAAEGWDVVGTGRDGGEGSWRFDRANPLPAAAFAGVSHILVSIPPDEAGDPVLAVHAADIAALPGLEWAGYLSTTGVYGDRAGGPVDEVSELCPTSARAQRRVAAEKGWLDPGFASPHPGPPPLAGEGKPSQAAQRTLSPASGGGSGWGPTTRSQRFPLHIFRLAGIYGPGRSAFDALGNGTARRFDRPGQVFSRIHVDDIVLVLRASIARPNPGAVYNVCDDMPAAPADVIAHAAALLGVAPPPLESFDPTALSPMAQSFWRDNKRVSNARIRTELGVRLRYPDYRAGLAAILAAGG